MPSNQSHEWQSRLFTAYTVFRSLVTCTLIFRSRKAQVIAEQMLEHHATAFDAQLMTAIFTAWR